MLTPVNKRERYIKNETFMKRLIIIASFAFIFFSLISCGTNNIKIIHNKDLVFLDTLKINSDKKINRMDMFIIEPHSFNINKVKMIVDAYAISFGDSVNKLITYSNYSMSFFAASDIIDINKIHTYSQITKLGLFAEASAIFEYSWFEGKFYSKIIDGVLVKP
jgi:hypothetical protein